VALLSFAVLGFEVALTRLFAVLLRYHFAFLVISIAVCGLGVGGYLTHWLRRRHPLPLGVLAILFAVFVDIAVALLLLVIFPLAPDAFWATALVVLVPFTCAGAFLAKPLRVFAVERRLYAWDLVGAALAAVAIVALLQTVSAINACLIMAMLAAIAGVLVLEKGEPSSTAGRDLAERSRNRPAPHVGFELKRGYTLARHSRLATQARRRSGITGRPRRHAALFTELGTSGHTSRIVDTRWNAFARTDVVAEQADPDTLLVYTNGNVPRT
jgi:hypothetical protein